MPGDNRSQIHETTDHIYRRQQITDTRRQQTTDIGDKRSQIQEATDHRYQETTDLRYRRRQQITGIGNNRSQIHNRSQI